MVPAEASVAVDLDAGGPMPSTGADTAEHLGVEMDELAWAFALETDNWFPRLQAIETAGTGSAEKCVDSRARQTGFPGSNRAYRQAGGAFEGAMLAQT
jgi:hypothetical protein